MSKKEMELWYGSVCKAWNDLPTPDDHDEFHAWENFFDTWLEDLYQEAGKPSHGYWDGLIPS